MKSFTFSQQGSITYHLKPVKSNSFGKFSMLHRIARQLALLLFITGRAAPALADGVVITAVGDIMLAGQASGTLMAKGFDYAFSGTAAELRKGDILVGNLEAPLAAGGTEFTGKKFRFRTRPAAAAALKRAGFDVLTLANNHIMDYGAQGLAETLVNLGRAEIGHAGAGADLSEARRGVLVEAKGQRVAFLAYSLTYPAEFFAGSGRPGTAYGSAGRVAEDIARARRNAEYVVVSFHWGAELAEVPKPYQQQAAHSAIDAGADLVLGHHPHVLQGIERYRGKTVVYSLGNFAFGSMSRSADRSMIVRVTLDGARQTVEVVPVNVLNGEVRFRPEILTGKRGDEVIARLNRLSGQFNTRLVASGGRYLLDGAPQTAALRR